MMLHNNAVKYLIYLFSSIVKYATCNINLPKYIDIKRYLIKFKKVHHDSILV